MYIYTNLQNLLYEHSILIYIESVSSFYIPINIEHETTTDDDALYSAPWCSQLNWCAS